MIEDNGRKMRPIRHERERENKKAFIRRESDGETANKREPMGKRDKNWMLTDAVTNG